MFSDGHDVGVADRGVEDFKPHFCFLEGEELEGVLNKGRVLADGNPGDGIRFLQRGRGVQGVVECFLHGWERYF